MANKGTPYEREICRLLSLWWSGGKDDDLFWRTAGSGARGTARRKKGKKSKEASDIRASSKDSAKFTKLISTEIKRGYSAKGLMDAVDRPKRLKPQTFELFIHQAMTAAENEDTPYWMLIHRRDRREAMVYFPYTLNSELRCFQTCRLPILLMHLRIRTPEGRKKMWLFGCTLKAFLRSAKPEDVRKAVKRMKERKNAARH